MTSNADRNICVMRTEYSVTPINCTRAVSNAFKVSLQSSMAQYLLSRFSLQFQCFITYLAFCLVI